MVPAATQVPSKSVAIIYSMQAYRLPRKTNLLAQAQQGANEASYGMEATR
jgi:hypothetical protein